MIVTCPACSFRYLVDPRALGNAGRTVRCANCAETWHQDPPQDFTPALDLAAPPSDSDYGTDYGTDYADDAAAPEGGRAAAARLPAVVKPRRPWAALGGIAAAALVLVALVASLIARDQVMAAFPSSMKLFGIVGLSPSSPTIGLEIRNLNTKRGSENGVTALIIDGEVANTAEIVRDVPRLTATLRDANGKDLESWNFAASETRLLPGAIAAFHTAIPQPSATAIKAVINFSASEQ